jgi:predicted TIM-barrel fold metal-dependent hydrolase
VTDAAPLCLPFRIEDGQVPTLPEGTCDCHFHVFDEGATLAPLRSYTPAPAEFADWQALADKVGIARGVVVQPSVYGQDNSVLLATLAAAPDRLRGVVVIGPDTPSSEVARLHEAGVRGVRVNLRNKAGLGLNSVPELARLTCDYGWHLVFQIGPGEVALVADIAAQHDVAVVIDHAAFAELSGEKAAAQIASLQHALDDRRVHVKLSAPYRLAPGPEYPGYGALIWALMQSHPEQLIWGTDWPHTEMFNTMPGDADLIAAMLGWLDSPEMRHKVLVANPGKLYWDAR